MLVNLKAAGRRGVCNVIFYAGVSDSAAELALIDSAAGCVIRPLEREHRNYASVTKPTHAFHQVRYSARPNSRHSLSIVLLGCLDKTSALDSCTDCFEVCRSVRNGTPPSPNQSPLISTLINQL